MEMEPLSPRLSGDSRFSCNICLETVSDEPVLTLCGHVYCWQCLYQWLKPGLTAAEQVELGIPRVATTSDASRRVCPTCKSSCSVRQVIPIYVRAKEEQAESSEEKETAGVDVQDDVAVEEGEFVDVNYREGLRRRNRNSSQQAQNGHEDGSHRLQRSTQPATNLDGSLGSESDGAIPPRESVFSHPARVNSLVVPSVDNDSIPRRPTVRLAERNEARLELAPQLYPSASLSHGMFPLVQQAIHDQPTDDGATEYLSRLLLLLGSFVILCLLVFP